MERSETVYLTDDEDMQNVGNEDSTMTCTINIWRTKIEQENEACSKFIKGILAISNYVGLIIGVINVDACPVDPKIPVFLIVTGVITIVRKLVSKCKNKLKVKKEMTKSAAEMIGCIDCLLHLVSVIFFILGSIWTYRIYQPSYDEHDIIYCNKTCYLYSFIYITLYYVVILSMIFLPIIFLCCGPCFICCATLCSFACGCCLACMGISQSAEQHEDGNFAEEYNFEKPHNSARVARISQQV